MTFNNIKITILCGFVTILVLRGTIGVNLGSSDSDAVNQNLIKETNHILAEIRSDVDPSDPDDQGKPHILLITTSPPKPYDNPIGDHDLLKSIKKEIDYCRLHGIEIVYNLAHLDVELTGYWAKFSMAMNEARFGFLWVYAISCKFRRRRLVEKLAFLFLIVHGGGKCDLVVRKKLIALAVV
ncbi:xyloglucan 6-xylosyltransferase [Vigna angularis]|uniref:Xyloglucan 6-xylosyltransferase n=1 Tax=Phaseolus angularis TaxID=3914 RepID=A0A8T0KDD5_PHAAN|nr:xyloglucan 6-xylosyltransferase [Vigna angularis]